MLDTTKSPHARLRTLPLDAVHITGGGWAERQRINREITLRHGYKMLDQFGNFHDLKLTAGSIDGEYIGPRYIDSDMYKWLEALAYETALHPDPDLQAMIDEVVDLMAAAQAEDGFLNTYFQAAQPEKRWTDLKDGHELYCAGHLFEAAVAHYVLHGNEKLLKIATRFADYIDGVFGPDKRQGTPGHPEIELALVKLYRLTGEQRYLDLAGFFIDQRGNNSLSAGGRTYDPAYYQDRLPVRQAHIIEGHAVRAVYLIAGVVDYYLETGDQELAEVMDSQWHDMAARKMYVTGGLGARHDGEAFGGPYELPNEHNYCETCAAIANVFWNWRMLLVTGERRYADVMERALYNGFISGMSLDGTGFFYVNPLLAREGGVRPQWHNCACCPPNIMRLIASLGSYAATNDESGLQLHLYVPSTIRAELADGTLAATITTDYPYREDVAIALDEVPGGTWTLSLRVPEWCRSATVSINGDEASAAVDGEGYIRLEREWQSGDMIHLCLEMAPTLVEADPRIDSTRGALAIQRGPIIYCLEQADQAEGVAVMAARIDPDGADKVEAVWREDLEAGYMALRVPGFACDYGAWEDQLYAPQGQIQPACEPVTLVAIPYALWANREPGPMRVWIPTA